jgi:hypothetical protein
MEDLTFYTSREAVHTVTLFQEKVSPMFAYKLKEIKMKKTACIFTFLIALTATGFSQNSRNVIAQRPPLTAQYSVTNTSGGPGSSYNCSYTVTCSALASYYNGTTLPIGPATATISPGGTYTFTFPVPNGASIIPASLHFVASTGSFTATFGNTSQDATGNCHPSTLYSPSVTRWFANSPTSFTINADTPTGK